MQEFCIVNRPVISVYDGPQETAFGKDGQRQSAVSDELLFGSALRILDQKGDWFYILSDHGYTGFIKKDGLLPATGQDVKKWMEQTYITVGSNIDILSDPYVEAERIISLPACSLVKCTGETGDGWSEVVLPDGTHGFTGTNWLGVRRFSEEIVYQDEGTWAARQKEAPDLKHTAAGGCKDFDFRAVLNRWYQGDEALFRQTLIRTAAEYLGTQYRWAGRSSLGIDCSGLIQICYQRCGVMVYRDAAIANGYPLVRLPDNACDSGILKPGDTMYFTGHVAMYIGQSLFIHSTGKAGAHGVVINSLDPDHALYREDLRESLYACAGLRIQNL